MKKIISKQRIYIELFLYYIGFIIFTNLITFEFNKDWADNILGVTGFVFGVILAFSIANRRQRLESIRSTLRKSDALYIRLFEYAKMESMDEANKVRNQIDNVLMAQIDYKLVDIDYTTGELIELTEVVAKSSIRMEIKKEMLNICGELIESQKEVIYRVTDKMRRIEWISLISLGGVMLLILNAMNIGTILSVIIISLISTSLVLFLIVLRELNDLSWQEGNWIWNPLIDVFTELGLLPYFPGDLYAARKITISHLKPMKEYRVAHYAHPYPNMDDKVIKIVKGDKHE